MTRAPWPTRPSRTTIEQTTEQTPERWTARRRNVDLPPWSAKWAA